MTKLLHAFSIAVLVLACSAPAATTTPPSTPAISNTPAPVAAPVLSRCPDGLGWLGRTEYLRYTEVANGHFGYSEMHADFHRRSDSDTFEGVVTMTYRERADSVPRTTARSMTLKHSDVTKLLLTMRDGIRTPPRPERGGVSVVDSSQTIMIALDAVASDAGGDLHVQFFVDGAQREPHDWGIRGCDTDPPTAAQRIVSDAADAFANRLERDATIQRLMTP